MLHSRLIGLTYYIGCAYSPYRFIVSMGSSSFNVFALTIVTVLVIFADKCDIHRKLVGL
jgi:hypothetical protein